MPCSGGTPKSYQTVPRTQAQLAHSFLVLLYSRNSINPVPSPDRAYRRRPENVAIRGDQRNLFNHGCSTNDSIRRILWIVLRKCQSPAARPAGNGQHCKFRLDTFQERVEVHVSLEPALARQDGQLKKANARDCQSCPGLPSLVNSSPGVAREFFRLKGQPEDHVRIDQDHARLPHSRSVRAGLTTSPLIFPLPL